MPTFLTCGFQILSPIQAGPKARELQQEADRIRAEAEDLKDRARLEDLSIWTMEKVKSSKNDSQAYYYWMATWRRRLLHLNPSHISS